MGRAARRRLAWRVLAIAVLVVASSAWAEAPGGDALAPCAALYASSVFDGAVDYDRLAADPGRAACARALELARPSGSGAGALAFWVDAYNLLTLLAIADEPTRWSAQQDGQRLFHDRRFSVAGKHLSLDEIERVEIAALTRDPRVEFLLSCGSRSCAMLPPAVPAAAKASGSPTDAHLDAAMADGMRRWFANPDNLRVRREAGVVEIGQLLQLDWHGGDFERAGTTLVKVVAEVLDARDPEAANALRCGALRLSIRPYDWRVNRVRRTYLLP